MQNFWYFRNVFGAERPLQINALVARAYVSELLLGALVFYLELKIWTPHCQGAGAVRLTTKEKSVVVTVWTRNFNYFLILINFVTKFRNMFNQKQYGSRVRALFKIF